MTETKTKREIAVRFRSFGVGKEAAGMGVSVSREALKTGEAIGLLVGARLEVTLSDGPAGPDMFEEHGGSHNSVDSVADVHRLSIGTDDMTFRLSFRKEDTDCEALMGFAEREGTLSVARIGDAGKDAAAEGEEA